MTTDVRELSFLPGGLGSLFVGEGAKIVCVGLRRGQIFIGLNRGGQIFFLGPRGGQNFLPCNFPTKKLSMPSAQFTNPVTNHHSPITADDSRMLLVLGI